jgi:hypothetical protein
MEEDFINFISNIETSYNLVNSKFIYEYNFVYKLQILTMLYTSSNVDTNIIENIINKLKDKDRINNFIIVVAYNVFKNIVNYDELITTLSNAITEIIYNTENSNYYMTLTNVWKTYFSTTYFN